MCRRTRRLPPSSSPLWVRTVWRICPESLQTFGWSSESQSSFQSQQHQQSSDFQISDFEIDFRFCGLKAISFLRSPVSQGRSGLEITSRNHDTGKQISSDDIIYHHINDIKEVQKWTILMVRFSTKQSVVYTFSSSVTNIPDFFSPRQSSPTCANADAGKPWAATS